MRKIAHLAVLLLIAVCFPPHLQLLAQQPVQISLPNADRPWQNTICTQAQNYSSLTIDDNIDTIRDCSRRLGVVLGKGYELARGLPDSSSTEDLRDLFEKSVKALVNLDVSIARLQERADKLQNKPQRSQELNTLAHAVGVEKRHRTGKNEGVEIPTAFGVLQMQFDPLLMPDQPSTIEINFLPHRFEKTEPTDHSQPLSAFAGLMVSVATINSDALEQLNIRSENNQRPHLPDVRGISGGQGVTWVYQVRPKPEFKATRFHVGMSIEDKALSDALPIDLTGEIKPQPESEKPGLIERLLIPNLTKVITSVLSVAAGAATVLLITRKSKRRAEPESREQPEAPDDGDEPDRADDPQDV